MLFAYTCPCCGEEICTENPFDVSCPCCGGRSGMSLSDNDNDNDRRRRSRDEQLDTGRRKKA